MNLSLAAAALLLLWWCSDLVAGARRTRFPTRAATTPRPTTSTSAPSSLAPSLPPPPTSSTPSAAPTHRPSDSPVELLKIQPVRKRSKKERCKNVSSKLVYDQKWGILVNPSVSADGKVMIYTTFIFPERKGYTIVLKDNSTHFVQTQALSGYGLERLYGADDIATISADASTIAISVEEEPDVASGYPADAIGAVYFYGWDPVSKTYEPQSGAVRGYDYKLPVFPYGNTISLGRPHLSADGGTALIGGFNDQGASIYDWPGGAAWVFVRNETSKTWSQQGPKFTNPDQSLAGFGVACSLSADGNIAFVVGDSSGIIFTRSVGVWKSQIPIYFQGANQLMLGLSTNSRFAFVTTTPGEYEEIQEQGWTYSVWIYDRDKNWTLSQGIYDAWYIGSIGTNEAASKSIAVLGTTKASMVIFKDNAKGKFKQQSSVFGAPSSTIQQSVVLGHPLISSNGYTVAASVDGAPRRWTCPALRIPH